MLLRKPASKQLTLGWGQAQPKTFPTPLPAQLPPSLTRLRWGRWETRQAPAKLHLGTSRLPCISVQSLKIKSSSEPIPFSLLLSAVSKDPRGLWSFINPKASAAGKHLKLPSICLLSSVTISKLCTCYFKQIKWQISLILLDIFFQSSPFT